MPATLAEPEFWTAPLEARFAEALLVLAPTDPEFRIVARRLRPSGGQVPASHRQGYRTACGRLGAFETCVVRSGVGHRATEAACLRFLPRPFGHALLVGFAGGLESGLPAGTLVRPDRVLSGGELEFLPSERLAAVGGVRGQVVASAAVLTDPVDKRILQATSGAQIVDLESAVFAFDCHRHAVPFTVLRAVSDVADQRLAPCVATCGWPRELHAADQGLVPRPRGVGQPCGLVARHPPRCRHPRRRPGALGGIPPLLTSWPKGLLPQVPVVRPGAAVEMFVLRWALI
jgi:nucleoside phosphorylase